MEKGGGMARVERFFILVKYGFAGNTKNKDYAVEEWCYIFFRRRDPYISATE
jgi:hypothetical protein